jgi:four helix bundle protein
MPEDWMVEDGNGFLMLNDISAYKLSFTLSNYIWDIVIKWNHFERDTVGKQFVRAIDSISANLAEGFGRYSKKDKIHFYRYSFGSVKESLDWNEKSKSRKLISPEEYQHILEVLNSLPREINFLIKFTDEKLKT